MKALLTFVLVIASVSGGANQRARVVPLWNEFAAATTAETEADILLQDSLKGFNPQLLAGPYEPRRELLDEAIRLSEERTKLLKEMRRAEFGEKQAQTAKK